MISLTFPGIPIPYQMCFSVVILYNHLDILEEGMKSNSCIVLLLILSQKSVVLIFFYKAMKTRIVLLVIVLFFLVFKHFLKLLAYKEW